MSRPPKSSYSRAARQRIRPEDPVNLEFERNTDYVPENFLRGDVKVDERRHLLLGLQQQYMSDISTDDFCRKLMALTFLPAEHIEPAFRNLVEHVSSGTELELATYIDTTWISGNWHPNDWSIFNQAVRTNNDVEGWHLRINSRARRSQLQFYVLIELLHK